MYIMASQLLTRDTSSPKTQARRKRTLSTPKDRMERTERAKLVTPYQGEDTEIFWATIKELSAAPFPFLDEIVDPKIRECVAFLRKEGFTVIAPRRLYQPGFIASGSSKKASRRRPRKRRGRTHRKRR